MVEMLKNAFQLDMSDRTRIAGQFEELGRVAVSPVPVFRLSYPHQHDLIGCVHEAVLGALSG